MKKALLTSAVVLFAIASFAQAHAVHKVNVSNFQFSPATTNAKILDTIIWVWKSGSHTTTSLQIPVGAKAWNSPINESKKRFRYVVKKRGTFNYQCNIHPTSMKGTIIVTGNHFALTDIDINTENANAILSWTADNVGEIASFSVQRSIDGDNFTEIAKVQPSALKTYRFIDEHLPSDKYLYYQISVMDKEGNTELSNIKMFTNNQQNVSKLITSISPNPISNPGHLMLQFNADADGKMLVQLFTQSGSLVTQTEMTANKGLNNGHFHLGELKPGTYYITCTLAGKTEKHTIVYQ